MLVEGCKVNIQNVRVVAEGDRPMSTAPITPNIELTRDIHRSTSLGEKLWRYVKVRVMLGRMTRNRNRLAIARKQSR